MVDPQLAFSIRAAGPGDAAEIGRIQSQCWRSTYAGLLPESLLVRMSPRRQARLWARRLPRMAAVGEVAFVATVGEQPVGFGTCGRESAGTVDCEGEVFTLYVEDDWQNAGIGRALVGHMFSALKGRGMDSAVIWVLEGNPARYFYEALGGTRGGHRTTRLWGRDVTEHAYIWSHLERDI